MTVTELRKLIIGKTCSRAWDGLLPAIFFELGLLQNNKKGEMSLCFDSLPWQMFQNDAMLADSQSNREEVLKALHQIQGQKISNVEFNSEHQTITIVFESLQITAHLANHNRNFYLLDADEQEILFQL